MGNMNSVNIENVVNLIDHKISDLQNENVLDQCVQRRNEVLSFYNKNRALLSKKFGTLHQNNYWLYHFNTEIVPILKHYLIFLRNTMLEIHIANVKEMSKSVSQVERKNFSNSTHEHLNSITSEYVRNLNIKWEWISNSNNQKIAALNSSLTLSPSKVYKKQIDQCGVQMSRIKNQDLSMIKTISSLNNIREDIENHLNKYIEQETALEQLLTNLNSKLHNHSDVLTSLTEAKTSLQNIPISSDNEIEWLDHLDHKVTELQSINIITSHSNGLLIEKNLELAKGTKKWVDMVLLPQHIQLRDQVEQNLNRVNTMLINAQHKYQLLEGKKNKAYHDEIVSTISSLSKNQKATTESISHEYGKIIEQSSSTLRADQLYDDQNWMVSGYDLSLVQLRSDTENIFKQIYDWGKNYITHATWIPYIGYDDGVDQIEKIAKLVHSKSMHSQLGHYQRVFMSDGFLSDYYLVHRSKEMTQVQGIADLWSEGFGTSLVISGTPLSGKTTFALQVVRHHWPDHFIQLLPHSSLNIGKKKVKCGSNISEALLSITNTLDKRKKWCILLDDIHTWHDKNTSLLENMESLRSFILRSPANILIVIAVGNHFLSRLQTTIKFSDAFMSHIDLSNIKRKQFMTTLRHRHDATQNELFGAKEEPLTNKQIENIGHKIWKYTDHNVGTSLNEWTKSISQNEKGQWKIDFIPHRYPKIVNEKSAALFNALLIYNRLSENRLKEVSDQMDSNEQQSILYNMLNSKVFNIDSQSQISINPCVNTEIQYQYDNLDDLEHKKYVIASEEMKEDSLELSNHVKELLFHYPFISNESQISFKTRKNKLYIKFLTMESPSALVDYLNDQQNKLQFQFIKWIKI